MGTDCLNKKTAEEIYISQWTINARQHFDDGDYEWICNKIDKMPGEFHKILELGCGAGYSTLVFLLRDFQVLSVDNNQSCIKSTKQLIEEHDYTVSMMGENTDEDAVLWNADLVLDTSKIRNFVRDTFPIDLIILCNPGGQLSSEITDREYQLLKICEFSDDEILHNIQTGKAGLLHKWAMIYAACSLSVSLEKPFLLIDRGTSEEDVCRNLKQAASDTGMRLINKCCRTISSVPEGGVRLGSADGEDGQCVWGMGVYFP